MKTLVSPEVEEFISLLLFSIEFVIYININIININIYKL